MVTDEERREIARKLRDLSSGADEVSDFDIAETLGLGAVSRYGYAPEDVLRLADLIEPEPERTCHYTSFGDYDDDGSGINVWYLSCGHDAINDAPYPPNYCPHCGATVVYE